MVSVPVAVLLVLHAASKMHRFIITQYFIIFHLLPSLVLPQLSIPLELC